MSNNGGNTMYNNLFSSLISDIKSYNGTDPILPWLRGIRKMKETLPPQLLKEKLPRFLQKCSETFLTDRRYFNDLRYLRVWLQLMDFVDDPKAVLRTMEENKIGIKKSLFYQAYALYYEKMKKFDAAEKIYHLGVQNLAEPADELQKSYEQFLHRIKRYKNKRVQIGETKIGETKRGHLNHDNRTSANSSNIELLNDQLLRKAVVTHSDSVKMEQEKNRKSCSDDTVVVKFVDTAIVGKSKTEDARHHGLVEPTINTKEAMNAINSMFQQPLEPSIASRKGKNQPKTDNTSRKNEGKIFTDETIKTDFGANHQPSDEAFEIYVDGEETNNASVFARPNDQESKPRKTNQGGFREDTVVYRFVGSTISDEPEVENVWHHGLVDPTVNLKEAMKDINSMFGKPIEFVRKSRAKKPEKAPVVSNSLGDFLILPDDEPTNKKAEDCVPNPNVKNNHSEFLILPDDEPKNEKDEDIVPSVKNNHTEFLILPDDDLKNKQDRSLPSSSTEKGSDLFEKTLCTKEAMDEINKLFAMPMDF